MRCGEYEMVVSRNWSDDPLLLYNFTINGCTGESQTSLSHAVSGVIGGLIGIALILTSLLARHGQRKRFKQRREIFPESTPSNEGQIEVECESEYIRFSTVFTTRSNFNC